MKNGIVFIILGYFFGNRGVPMLIHWIYIALVIAAYKYGQTHV